MDPLSDVLSLLKPRTYASGRLTAGGCWAVEFPAFEGIKCYAAAKGECLVLVDGEPAPVRILTGECIMLPRGRSFRLCSSLDAPAVDARTLIPIDQCNGVLTVSPGEEFVLLGGHFVLDENADILLGVLPPFVHLRKESDKAALRGAVERIMTETRDPQPGGLLIAQQSAYTLLVLALRLYMAESEATERGRVGWLFALADKQIGGSIRAIHEKPSHAWTVLTLAEKAGMSRTTFAERFRKSVGASPMEYLTRWRMLLASDRLLHSTDSISTIAESAGYDSESAFSAAFKRTMGASPREYARRQNGA